MTTEIEYIEGSQEIGFHKVADLFGSVGFGTSDFYKANIEKYVDTFFSPGCYSYFAMDGDELIGLIRVYSDNRICSWISEVCVRPDWQRKGVGSDLMKLVLNRFGHSAIYVNAFKGMEEFFVKNGLNPKPVLVACSRGPRKILSGEDQPSFIH